MVGLAAVGEFYGRMPHELIQMHPADLALAHAALVEYRLEQKRENTKQHRDLERKRGRR